MKRLLLILLLFTDLGIAAQQIPARPSPPRLVNDYTGVLTPAQAEALERKLVAFDDSTSSQIAIVIIRSLDGYDIAEYALEVGRNWGVGGKEFSNGILVLVALDDRRSRIEVGYGLEGAVPDITAKSILDNSITPHFRDGNYYRGLDQATNDLITAAAGEYKAPEGYGKRGEEKGGISMGWIIIAIVFFMIFGGMGGGGGRGRDRGMASAAGWLLGSMLGNASRGRGGWSGGGGGGWSGGGGGFGGFGGGGFGGGGASGSW